LAYSGNKKNIEGFVLSTFDFSRLGILLIEDNSFVRQTLEDLLRQFRFGRLATAKNGEEAIDYMKTLGSASSIIAPDIIISDLVMTPIAGDGGKI